MRFSLNTGLKFGRVFLLVTFFFSLVCILHAQGVTPAQQAKIDSMMNYIREQSNAGKVADRQYIDSVNAVIRSMNTTSATGQAPGSSSSDSIRIITKQVIGGGTFTVPEGKTWQLKKLLINDGGSYNIVVTSIGLDKVYSAGEKISLPSWTAEGELLSGDQSMFTYTVTFWERVKGK